MLETCRPSQLLPGHLSGAINCSYLCLKAKPYHGVLLSGCGTARKEMEQGNKKKLKARDVGEGHQLSTSAGHYDIPFLSVTPQDSNSEEWALPRLPLLPSKATATIPNLQLLSPLFILHPEGRAAPHDCSPIPWQGQGILIPPPSCLWDRGSQPSLSPAPWQGGLCHRDHGSLVLPNLLSVLQGQGWGTLRRHRDRMTLLVSEPRGRTWTCTQGAAPTTVPLTW